MLLYLERMVSVFFLYQPDIVTMKQKLLSTLYAIQNALARRVLLEGKCHKYYYVKDKYHFFKLIQTKEALTENR